MKEALAFLVFTCTLIRSEAQIIVRTVTEKRFEKLEYPNQSLKSKYSMPVKGVVNLKDGTTLRGTLVCFRKNDALEKVRVTTGNTKKEISATAIKSVKLDPVVEEQKYPNNYKNPERNFQTGYMLLRDGARIKGKIAQERESGDYDFFIHGIFFLPDQSNVASFIRGGALHEFGQEIDGTLQIWDGYADGYLKRLVDGRYRLTRKPYSSSSEEWFTSLKDPTMDTLTAKAATEAFSEDIKSGKDINSSIEDVVSAGDFVEALGNIDLSGKEYFIYDTRKRTLLTVNKDHFKEISEELTKPCKDKLPSDPAERQELTSWDHLEEFVQFLNTSCK